MSTGLPRDVFVIEMQHKYAVGDKVRINGKEGEITALIPYTFVAPAYYVKIDDTVVAFSERSIKSIDE
jgi:hypothetical protein